jgi:hypothetical protein
LMRILRMNNYSNQQKFLNLKKSFLSQFETTWITFRSIKKTGHQ